MKTLSDKIGCATVRGESFMVLKIDDVRESIKQLKKDLCVSLGEQQVIDKIFGDKLT